MNTLIQLKGKLEQSKNMSPGGSQKLNSKDVVESSNLEKLIKDLEQEMYFWKKENYFKGALINVNYKRIVPKSKRISYLFFYSLDKANNSIKGARYTYDKNGRQKHIITYYIQKEAIESTIKKIKICNEIIKKELEGNIDQKRLEKFVCEKEKIIKKYGLSKSSFINILVDCSTIESFSHPVFDKEYNDNIIYTLFDIDDKSPKELLENIGVKYSEYVSIDKNTVILDRESYNIVSIRMPYIISTQTYNLADFELDNDVLKKNNEKIENSNVFNAISSLPKPSNEPIIGVLDTGFNKNVYFSEWVDYHDEYWRKDIELEDEDYKHGTSIDSIIVDGPSLNPDFQDNCGRFKVRHFLIAKHSTNNNVITLIRNIQKIVESNLDIKVWNLSLGSRNEIDDNFISHEAAMIDYLEFKYDIIFVISGTNKDSKNQIKIGSPADSINSLVVNSVKKSGEKASYARKGKVLYFFNKPDICYYGGDIGEEFVTVNNDFCIYKTKGTSIAAPWISRKLAFLIYKLGLSREIAKALIIDSATNWNAVDDNKAEYYGFGCVPIDIRDIINTPKDEIKFFIEETSYEYDTYTHQIPVPISNSFHPYLTKATLCYFPNCDRNSGVDYTNTELDIYFGRLTQKTRQDGSKYYTIKSIINNQQTDENVGVTEEDARKFNRKWDNVKHLVEEFKSKNKPRKSYENPMWGLSVKTKERLNNKDGKGIKFGVVITLKEINGVNRFDEFIKQCSFRGWLVNKIDVENQLNLYNKAEEEIKFE